MKRYKIEEGDWITSTSPKSMLETNWMIYMCDRMKGKEGNKTMTGIWDDMWLKFKDNDIQLGLYQPPEKLEISDAQWNKKDNELIFSIYEGGCEICEMDEVFRIKLQILEDNTYEKRLLIESNVECDYDLRHFSDSESDSSNDEEEYHGKALYDTTWIAYPEDKVLVEVDNNSILENKIRVEEDFNLN